MSDKMELVEHSALARKVQEASYFHLVRNLLFLATRL